MLDFPGFVSLDIRANTAAYAAILARRPIDLAEDSLCAAGGDRRGD